MDLFDQSAHQRLPIQLHAIFGFYLGEDLRDMEGTPGALKYVYAHINIRHTFIALRFLSFRPGGFELAKGSQLSAEHKFIERKKPFWDFGFHSTLL
jgi:hypothetical protein